MGESTSFWVLDLTGTVHLSGTYAHSIFAQSFFWSADGRRLAVSRENPETSHFEWEILALEDGASERVGWGEVLSSPDWLPNRERDVHVVASHSGAFVA